jgi:hypothetical protein
MLKKYIVQYCHANMVGTDMAENCWAGSAEEAVSMFEDIAREWAEGFESYDCEEDTFDEECNFECWAEEYDPKEHDGLCAGCKEWDWERCAGI